jgi:hypothetical protein
MEIKFIVMSYQNAGYIYIIAIDNKSFNSVEKFSEWC